MKRTTTGARRALAYSGVAAIVAYCLAPCYWMLASALRRPSDQFSNSLIPAHLSLDNFSTAFDPAYGFGRGLVNSVVVAGATTLITLLLACCCAYALARLRFRAKPLVLGLIAATAMFPGITLLIPLLKLFTGVGWINTYQAMVLPSLSFGLPLAVWNLTAFFKQLPHELEEAAAIDGCSPLRAFVRVVLPLAAPGVFTTAILVFIASWNEFLFAVSVVNKKDMMTANVVVSLFNGKYGYDQPYGSQMAAGAAVTLPLVVAVLFFQRRIVAGLTAGGVK